MHNKFEEAERPNDSELSQLKKFLSFLVWSYFQIQ